MLPLLFLLGLVPPAVSDLRVSEQLSVSGIAWHLTVPAVNDSSCSPDSTGEVVCVGPHRYVAATDTITYHWTVGTLEDSMRVARGEHLSLFYPFPRIPWRQEFKGTQHWFSRAASWPMEAHYVESKRVSRLFWIKDY